MLIVLNATMTLQRLRLRNDCGAFSHALENERGAWALRSLFGVLARPYDAEALERASELAVAEAHEQRIAGSDADKIIR